MKRLDEVSSGKEIDPNADISLNGLIPMAVIVDPDTNNVYSAEHAGNYWPSRWVIWKTEAATQQARVVVGHFSSREVTGKSYGQMSGFRQRATAASLGRVYTMAIHPVTKELHFIGYPAKFARDDATGNLQAVECVGCNHKEISAITYHKREKQWIVMGGNFIVWQNGTTIVGKQYTGRDPSAQAQLQRGPRPMEGH